ncbi:MAG: arginine--tRNA ligase [Patescibacteria group bacterium]|jgi:arginyl-tRNA synthetase
MTAYLAAIKARVESVLGNEYVVTTELPHGQTAWLAVPVFARAKAEGRAVPEVATDVAAALREALPDVDVTAAGGFVNITPHEVQSVLVPESLEQVGDAGLGKTIVIDYSQPNIAKRMSVGHLRSTIIGHTLRALYEALGYTVVGINYLGDWGTQYGKLVVAYERKYGDLVPRDTVTIQELFDLYVGYHADDDGSQDDAARAMFKLLEDGDPAVTALWQFFVDLSLEEYQMIYDRLHVSFTEPKMGESAHRATFDEVTGIVRSAGVSRESEGAEIVELPDLDAPMILRKSDGATTYATRDLAALKYRVETYSPEAVLYVVSNEQTLHFRQVFAVARMVGIAPESVALEHVKFGFVRLPEGKMSTRAGRVVFLEEVLDEAVRRARVIVDEKNPDLPETQRAEIAEVVGIGAVKFFDLSHDRKHDIVFDWDRMLSLSGDSAPYLQYTYTRAAQILGKITDVNQIGTQRLADLPTDVQLLLRTLAKYPLVVEAAARQYAPHTLAQYLLELAGQFSRFYENYPVLQSSETERPVRRAIVERVATTLRQGLGLLGIDVLETM